MHVAIIGGGITGLSAAWELQRRGVSYTLLEASARWGGKLVSATIARDGARFLVEGGPDTIVTRKPEAWDLANELGMSDRVTNPGSETSGIFVLDDGKLHAVPISPLKFVRSRLLTTGGKFRMLAEPFQPARRDDGDESLADFVSRRLGREALEKFIGPVLGGIYNTDPEKQSIMVSSPVMREMEKEGGGLFMGALLRAFKPKKKKTGAPRFINFKSGINELPDELARQLTGDLRLNSPVEKIARDGTQFRLFTAGGDSLAADGIIFATLAPQTAALLKDLYPEVSRALAGIRHQNIGTVSLVYRVDDIPREPVINGLMIPRREKRMIDAITFASRKMPERFAPGYAALRVFIGGGAPEMVEYPDDQLLAMVQKELAELMNISTAPLAWKIFRWQNGFPQAEVGHLERIDALEKQLPQNIALAGSSYRGIAVPDCIRQGREAAERISKTF